MLVIAKQNVLIENRNIIEQVYDIPINRGQQIYFQGNIFLQNAYTRESNGIIPRDALRSTQKKSIATKDFGGIAKWR